jgi:glutathione S-transferase
MGPSGPNAEAAEIAQWISIVATTVDQTLIRRYVAPYAFPKGADGSPDRTAIEAVLPDLRNVFTMLEMRLSGRDYLAAHRFTFGDALLLTTLNPTLRRVGATSPTRTSRSPYSTRLKSPGTSSAASPWAIETRRPGRRA